MESLQSTLHCKNGLTLLSFLKHRKRSGMARFPYLLIKSGHSSTFPVLSKAKWSWTTVRSWHLVTHNRHPRYNPKLYHHVPTQLPWLINKNLAFSCGNVSNGFCRCRRLISSYSGLNRRGLYICRCYLSSPLEWNDAVIIGTSLLHTTQ